MLDPINDAQQRFNAAYITTTEVQRKLGVSRAAVLYARRRGILPEPIVVNDGQLTIWEREALQPYYDAWRAKLCATRAGTDK